MNDFVIVRSENYITIANAFLKDKNLSNKAKGVLAMILSLPENWDFSIKGMVAITKDGEASLRAAINEMRDNGYCAIKPVRINNKIARWKYLFSGEKLTESLLCDFLQVEKLQVENQAQYNNINNNISSINTPDKELKNKKRLSNDNPKKGVSSSRFVKPTIEEIAAYIEEKKYHFDAEQFWNHYESVGWMIGKNHMKNWKSSCATWEGRRKQQMKEEKEEREPEIPAADIDPWNNCQHWMEAFTPNLAKVVTYDDFARMRGCAHFDGKIFAEIMKKIEAGGFTGDVVKEFERIFEEEYRDKV